MVEMDTKMAKVEDSMKKIRDQVYKILKVSAEHVKTLVCKLEQEESQVSKVDKEDVDYTPKPGKRTRASTKKKSLMKDKDLEELKNISINWINKA